jgi:hypothetical protein
MWPIDHDPRRARAVATLVSIDFLSLERPAEASSAHSRRLANAVRWGLAEKPQSSSADLDLCETPAVNWVREGTGNLVYSHDGFFERANRTNAALQLTSNVS